MLIHSSLRIMHSTIQVSRTWRVHCVSFFFFSS